MGRSIILAALALVLVGCGPKAETTKLNAVPPGPLTAGFYRNSGEGFTFDMPDTWKRPRGGKGPNTNALFNVSQPGAMIGVNAGVDDGSKDAEIVLVDTSARTALTDAPLVLNVVVKEVKDGANLKQETDALVSRVYDGVRNTKSELNLPVGPGMLVTASRSLKTGDVFHFADLVLVDGTKVYMFRFTHGDAKMLRSLAEACANSFRPDASATTKVQQQEDLPDLKELMDQVNAAAGSAPMPEVPPGPGG